MLENSPYSLEKLAQDLKGLTPDDMGQLVPVCIGIQSVLWPKIQVETCSRSIQFMIFEMQKACEGKSEAERWNLLHRFLFEDKGFQLSDLRANEITINQILIKEVVEGRVGHPLPMLFLLLHLSHILGLPLRLLQARHHFLLKWIPIDTGKNTYLDFFNRCQPLSDQELIHILNRSASNLEVWSAKQLITQYLELLVQSFERHQLLTQLHTVYNLLLHLDDTNTALLGQRALLRQKLGYGREALGDLKRYFSFVELKSAPSELYKAWRQLESGSDIILPSSQSSDHLH